MAGKEIFLTKEKLAELKNELDALVNIKRPEVVAKIREARALGDLSENAEYHGAREEQSFMEGKIEELEYMIKNAKIISEKHSKEFVDLGCKVECHMESDGKQEFMIVGSAEVDVEKGKISNESPIGSALMGKKVGETVEVKVPDGVIKYKILKIV